MSRSISLPDFEGKFADDPDPWHTFQSRDEALKRSKIVKALGLQRHGRVLEVAAGNGSNSRALAARALRLEVTEGTRSGMDLLQRNLASSRRSKIERLVLPARPPARRYQAIVIAELLYYLSDNAFRETAEQLLPALSPGGVLVLAHHHIPFHDTAQRERGIHARFLKQTSKNWRLDYAFRTSWWIVNGFRSVRSRSLEN